MIRAFLAIDIPPELRAALSAVQQDLKRRFERTVDRRARISWVQPTSMHPNGVGSSATVAPRCQVGT